MVDADAILGILEARPSVRLVYLVGSAVAGPARRRSAVRLDDDGTPAQREALLAELERATRRRVDLVDLADAPLLLAHEVLAPGRRLVCRDQALRAGVETRTILRYLDTAHLRRLPYGDLEERAASRRARAT
jgi:predicted nucleotidyltransferase